MNVSCVLSADDVREEYADLVLFPEGVPLSDIQDISTAWPNALIAGAITDNKHSRGLLYCGSERKIDYLKVRTDGRTQGSNNVQQHPVYENAQCCVGILVCMDVDDVTFSTNVIEHVRASRAPQRLICIPADMGSHWFSQEDLWIPKWGGVNVVLCNNVKTHESRCKSFVTDRQGHKVHVQNDKEPIYAVVPEL